MSEIIERLEHAIGIDSEPDAETAAPAELTPYADALPVPPVLRPDEPDVAQELVVEQRATWVRLHSQLPPSLMWGYNGHVPGPTIEVRRRQRLRVAWTNRVDGGPYPVTDVSVPVRPKGQPPASTEPGRGGADPNPDVAALPSWFVTHLHGALTGGGNDGWADNAVGTGDAQLSEYPNDHRATAWWYHDHAMNITRFNVHTGLSGMYLVRDDEEDALGLPSGERELPLIVVDRNLDTDADGRLTGRILHKTVIVDPKNAETGEPVTLPFTGPYTTVNGKIWPHVEVDAAWYRFRLLNASNARIYNLVLVDEDNRPVKGVLKQIGSDGGLLPAPVDIDFEGALPALTVAPAERMDLLIDFRALRGRKVRLVNRGSKGPGVPDPAGDIRYPQVMEFRVAKERTEDGFVLPGLLAGSFEKLTHDIEHSHRMVLLTPPGTKGGGGEPEIWEMEPVPDGEQVETPAEGVVQIRTKEGKLTTYRRISRTFNDALGFMVSAGGHEQWSFLNVNGPTHPMHIHLTDFQILARDAYTTDGFDPALGGTRKPLEYDGTQAVPVAPNEQGWKEVFRAPANQMLSVMGKFAGAYGRFMYHCHLLEHEDMGMMRPFVVMPPEAMKFDHGAHGHDGGGHSHG